MVHQSCNITQQDYHGCTLRMTTLPWEPFIIRHQTDNGTWYTGLCIDLINYIARHLNFTYTVSEPPDQSWGHPLANGTWVGLTAILMREEADFTPVMVVTSERASVSDYTTGFYYDELVLLASRPTVQTGWTFFLRPFHWLVYTVIGASLVIVTALHVCLIRYGDWRISTHGDRSTSTSSCSLIGATAEMLFGTLLGRAVSLPRVPTPPASRALLFTWLLTSLITAAIYGGKLTSLSVVKRAELPFKTLRELVHQDDYKWGFFPGSFYDSQLRDSSREDFQTFYRRALDFAEDDVSVLAADTKTHLQKVVGGRYVYLAAYSDYRVFKPQFCQLTLLPERLWTTTSAIHLPKHSPYTRDFSHAIDRAKEFGLLEYWTRKWFPETAWCDSRQAEVTSVSLEHMQGALMVVVVGVGLACVVLVTETTRRYGVPNIVCRPQLQHHLHHWNQPTIQ